MDVNIGWTTSMPRSDTASGGSETISEVGRANRRVTSSCVNTEAARTEPQRRTSKKNSRRTGVCWSARGGNLERAVVTVQRAADNWSAASGKIWLFMLRKVLRKASGDAEKSSKEARWILSRPTIARM